MEKDFEKLASELSDLRIKISNANVEYQNKMREKETEFRKGLDAEYDAFRKKQQQEDTEFRNGLQKELNDFMEKTNKELIKDILKLSEEEKKVHLELFGVVPKPALTGTDLITIIQRLKEHWKII